MTPPLTYIHAQTYVKELRRGAHHRSGVEAHVRQMIRRAPPRQVTRRTRQVPVASHH
jgi:hypothetical protein